MRFSRVLKGIVVSAITWTAVLIPVLAGAELLSYLLGAPLPPPSLRGFLLVRRAVAAAISGAAFGTMIALYGRRRSFAKLSMRRDEALTFPLSQCRKSFICYS